MSAVVNTCIRIYIARKYTIESKQTSILKNQKFKKGVGIATKSKETSSKLAIIVS